MFCPECKAEYRPCFVRCADCGIELVESLPESDNAATSSTSYQEAWAGEDQDECISICAQFRKNGIPFKVIQRRQQFLKGLQQHFRIDVPRGVCGRAEETIRSDRLGVIDGATEGNALQVPTEDGVAVTEGIQDVWPLEEWLPEDATVEIWLESSRQHAAMIELSLHENRIRTRVEVSENGSRRIFVKPEAEARARKIVHEIENGIPPN